MPKSTVKGNQFEIEVKKILEADGWNVFRQHRKPMFIKGRMITVGADIFGSDMVCKKPGEKPLWIQVSTVDNKSAKAAQMAEWPWNLKYETAQLWLRESGKRHYRIFQLATNVEDNLSEAIFEEIAGRSVSGK